MFKVNKWLWLLLSPRGLLKPTLLLIEMTSAVKHFLQWIIQSVAFGVHSISQDNALSEFLSLISFSRPWACIQRLDTRRLGVCKLEVFLLSKLHEESSHRLLW